MEFCGFRINDYRSRSTSSAVVLARLDLSAEEHYAAHASIFQLMVSFGISLENYIVSEELIWSSSIARHLSLS
jgi:hypothetical protein